MRIINVLVICLFISSFLAADELKNTITSIPQYDLQEIKSLFKDLFDTEGFAHTLYGDKPLSFSDSVLSEYSSFEMLKFLSLDDYCETVLKSDSEPPRILRKKWETWEKYQHLFDIKNYSLIKKRYRKQTRIFFINKHSLKQAINKNIKLFQKHINSCLSEEDLFNKITLTDVNIFEDLNHHEGLLGILLGFGKRNSMLFQRREEIIELPIANKELKLKAINEKLKPSNEDDCILYPMHRVGFVGDLTHPETIYLKEKYDKIDRKIEVVFSKDDWFEQILIRLTSNSTNDNDNR